jgi:hypothetical protein
VPVRFTVGLKLKGKTDRIAVDAEDALIAALRVKTERPEAVITYVRQQNRRGDARHPSHGLSEDRHWGTMPAGDQLLQAPEDREVRLAASLHRASRWPREDLTLIIRWRHLQVAELHDHMDMFPRQHAGDDLDAQFQQTCRMIVRMRFRKAPSSTL